MFKLKTYERNSFPKGTLVFYKPKSAIIENNMPLYAWNKQNPTWQQSLYDLKQYPLMWLGITEMFPGSSLNFIDFLKYNTHRKHYVAEFLFGKTICCVYVHEKLFPTDLFITANTYYNK